MCKLTDSALKAAKPRVKEFKLSDGKGLFLAVRPNGQKFWLYQFRLIKKQCSYHLGMYPDVSLKRAREAHSKAREYVSQGIHPKAIKQQKEAEQAILEYDFEYYFKQWLSKQNLALNTSTDLVQRIEKNILPYVKGKKINELTTLTLLKILQRVSDRGARETAKRLATVVRNVFDIPVLLGVIESNPAEGLRRLLPEVDFKAKKNFSHITSEGDLRVLLRGLDIVRPRQDYTVTLALKLSVLLFLRPANIRYLKWSHIDQQKREIRFEAEDMKKARPFLVPLSTQALNLLEEARMLNSEEEYVFVTSRSRQGAPMSENTINKALQTTPHPETGEPLGKGFITHHGLRHTASTFLNEMNFNPDIIEVQLAHLSRDSIRQTYNKAEWLPKRHEMMQAWADYLDGLRAGAVVPIKRSVS